MRLEDCVAVRRTRDPLFAGQQSVAKAELAFGHAVERHREAGGLSYANVVAVTGIAAERLEAIEEGVSASLAEVVWLCYALDMEISIDAGFNLESAPKVEPRVAVGAG